MEVLSGNLLRFAFTLDVGDDPADPETLTLVLHPPTGDDVELSWEDGEPFDGIDRDSAGRFHADYAPPTNGQWTYRWEARGAGDELLSASTGTFRLVAGKAIEMGDVTPLMATGIEEEELQKVIDREEGRLEARLKTPLTGALHLTLYPTRRWDPVLLPRLPIESSVVVKEDGVEVEVLVDGARVTRKSGPWASTLELDMDLGDGDEVRAVLLDLIRLTLTEAPYSQEASEGHSYSRSGTVERQRSQLVATLNPHRGLPQSVPM